MVPVPAPPRSPFLLRTWPCGCGAAGIPPTPPAPVVALPVRVGSAVVGGGPPRRTSRAAPRRPRR
eukprot:5449630-Pleurochrysis_carterae.AAC.1